MGFGGLLGKSTTTYSDKEILSSSVKNQLGLGADATPSDAFALLGQTIASGARIVTGSYVGTGTSGQNNPTRLTVDGEPKLLVVAAADSNSVYEPMVAIKGMTHKHTVVLNGGNCTYTWGSNYVEWYGYYSYGDGADFQYNSSGITYVYLVVT